MSNSGLRKTQWINWVYVTPALLMIFFVNVIPIGQTIWWSSDFSRLLEDARLGSVLGNTFLFTFCAVGAELVLGLTIALLLAQKFRGRAIARAAVLIPWALPTAVMAMAWRWIFNSDYGVLGDILFKFHLVDSPKIPWLASPGLAFFSCLLADVWKTTPFMAILLMSGLSAIPKELYEAAVIDGAGAWKRFWMITLPMLKPTILVAVIFRAIQTFGIFDLIWVLTGGGPGGKTQTIALYIYDTVFRYQELGYGCTLTLVMAGALLGFSAIFMFLLRPKTP